MKNKRLFITGVIFILTLLLILIYFLSIRQLVVLAYNNQGPDWFMNLISEFYPRFFIEKYRFKPEFFLAKADQVILRFSFVSILSCLILLLPLYNKRLKNYILDYFNKTTSTATINALRILFFLSIIILFYDIYWVLKGLELMKAFYKPISLLKLFHLEFPSKWIILSVCIILYSACILGTINLFPIINSIIVLVLFIYIQGIVFSFEKLDHGFAPMTYVAMIMPFLLFEVRNSNQKNTSEVSGWPLQLIQLLICLCYFFAGIEKLFIAQLEWLHPDTFRTYLLIHHTKAGMWIASSNILCTILPTAALIFQLGFISILFNKRLIPYFLIAGIVFHISTFFLFDVGGILHPWVLTYFFFINWEKLLKSRLG